MQINSKAKNMFQTLYRPVSLLVVIMIFVIVLICIGFIRTAIIACHLVCCALYAASYVYFADLAVNKNLVGGVGTGLMTADQKKKLLWGNKKATAAEEVIPTNFQ